MLLTAYTMIFHLTVCVQCIILCKNINLAYFDIFVSR